MASEEERAKIMAEYHAASSAAAAAGGADEDEWEDDDGADFDPAGDASSASAGSDDGDEYEAPADHAVLTGTLHRNEEGRIICAGTWCMRSVMEKEKAEANIVVKKKKHPKFKLKSQCAFYSAEEGRPSTSGEGKPKSELFDLRRPTLAKLPAGDEKAELPPRRTMMFDGFFFEPPPADAPSEPTDNGEGKKHHHPPVGTKIKEKNVEFCLLAGTDDAGTGAADGSYRVMGRGRNEYGPFVLEGTYSYVAPPPADAKSPPEDLANEAPTEGGAEKKKDKEKKAVASVVCNKTYGVGGTSKATARGTRRGRRVEDDDSFDDDFDERADYAEVNELCEDAGLSVEELRRKYYGGGGGGGEEMGDGGGKASAAKRARLEESDDECGF